MNRRFAALFLALSVAAACASPQKSGTFGQGAKKPAKHGSLIVSPKTTEPSEKDTLYRNAENFYSAERYSDAVQAYLKFITRVEPGHPLIDNAYFKVGMSWFEMERYRDALYYFESVTSRFPNSEVFTEALINSAISQFQLNDYKKAEATFKEVSEFIGNPGHKAYIHFYQGSIVEKRSDFVEAAGLFILAERMAEDSGLVKEARSKVERILHNFLSESELITITQSYHGQWPAKLAFEELLRIYRQSGDTARYGATRELYDEQFAARGSVAGVEHVGDDTYQPERIKIGAVFPLSGPSSQTGREIVQGIQLAFNSFHSLIREKQIQLIIKDSGAMGAGAEQAVREIAEDQDSLMTLGPMFSQELERAAIVADRHRMPLLSPSATAEGVVENSDYLFRNTLTNSAEAKKIAELAVNRLGLKRFVILYPDNNYGEEMNRFFTETVESIGGEIVTAVFYNEDQTDFGEQIRAIGGMTDEELRETILKNTEDDPEKEPLVINEEMARKFADKFGAPQIITYGELPLNRKNFLPGLSVKYDAVFLPGVYDKVGLILPELEFYNIKDITRLSGKGINHPDLIRIAERFGEGVVFLDGFFIDSQSPNVRSFVRDYQLFFHQQPSILAAQAFDAARISLSAIAHGANSRRTVKEYLASLTFYEGVTGVTNMNRDGNADKNVFFLTVEGGKITGYVPPEPEPAAEGVDRPGLMEPLQTGGQENTETLSDPID